MDHSKIERINELARKKRNEGLNAEEQAEQKELYREYIAEFRASMQATLDNVIIENPDGSQQPLQKKKLN